MIIRPQEYNIKNINYIIRSAMESDAAYLSVLRVQIDGEIGWKLL